MSAATVQEKPRSHAAVTCQVTGLGRGLLRDVHSGTEGEIGPPAGPRGPLLAPGSWLPRTRSCAGGTGVGRVQGRALTGTRGQRRCARPPRAAGARPTSWLPRGLEGRRGGRDADPSRWPRTDLVLCPYEEPFSRGFPPPPRRGRGRPRHPDSSASGSRNGPLARHPPKDPRPPPVAKTGEGQNHLESFAEGASWDPHPGVARCALSRGLQVCFLPKLGFGRRTAAASCSRRGSAAGSPPRHPRNRPRAMPGDTLLSRREATDLAGPAAEGPPGQGRLQGSATPPRPGPRAPRCSPAQQRPRIPFPMTSSSSFSSWVSSPFVICTIAPASLRTILFPWRY